MSNYRGLIMARQLAFVSFWLIPTLLLSSCHLIEGIFSSGEELSSANISLSPQYCGDNLENIGSYPTKIYPVFFGEDNNDIGLLENSEEYRFIKSNFCQNVTVGYGPKIYNVLVLGYFLDKTQAEDLKNTIGNYLSDITYAFTK